MQMQHHFDLAPDEWAALRRLLDEALDLPADARLAWVDALSAPHAAFKPRLRALLSHADEPHFEQLLRTLPKIETGEFAGPAPSDHAGARIGPYRLLRQIGEGGMASVWLAERCDLLQGRQVALKLPHQAWRGNSSAERLAREREILATLAHPHIARLYDAGVAGDGQPYLALEYIEGERIDVHCRDHGLGLRERLQLFLQVARAVAHAHARLVVHRDLKPSNILVDTDGQARLLDFGIAKLLEQGVAEETALTRETGRALTPDYAAPEQIRGEPIGTAADIYSLGVLLFELLTGERPYRLDRDSRAALEEAILQADPPRPSTVVADARLRRQLRGDLDTIVLKAMKKAPAERYATADAFTADIERHLADEPVHARPDSRWYRTRKLVLRHKVAVVATAAVFGTVLSGAAAAVWQAREAIAERQRAEEVKAFIVDLFEKADPYVGQGKVLSAADLLKQARARIDGLHTRPELRAELLHLVASGLGNLHDYVAAESMIDQAVEAARTSFGPADGRTLRARVLRSEINRVRGRIAEASDEIDNVVQLLRSQPDPAADLKVLALVQRAHLDIDRGRGKDAVVAAREALALATQRLGPRNPHTVTASQVYAVSLQYVGDPSAALPAMEHALQLTQALYGEHATHPRLVEAQLGYGRALADAGRLAEGIAMLERADTGAQAALGPDAFTRAFVKGRLARYRIEIGDPAQALDDIDTSLRILRLSAQEDSVNVAFAKLLRGNALLALRQPEQALADLEQATASLARQWDRQHPSVIAATAQQAMARAMAGDLATAETALRGLPPTPESLHAAGLVRRLAGDAAGARRLQDDALAALPAGRTAGRLRPSILTELGLAEVAAGAPDEAAGHLAEALAHSPAKPTPQHADAWVGLGRAHIAQARAADALPLLQQADQFWRDRGAHHRWAGEAAFWLGRCHAALGQAAAARSALARAAPMLDKSSLPLHARPARP
jgi:serine/threonine protein kinase/tetratricopeptide (TPR) repeat protein